MGRNARHIAVGIEAVIPNANAVTPHDVWVPVEDMPKAVRFVMEQRGTLGKPEVYAGKRSDHRVCLRL